MPTTETSLTQTTKTPTWYIKTAIISILLFIQTFILGTLIEAYILKADYFSLSGNNNNFLYIGLSLLGILITYSLSIGGWNKLDQYIYIPLSIGFGLLLILFKYNTYNGITVSLILTLLVAYNVYKATVLRKLLIKFEPKFILDTSLKGFILVFSLFAVAILMIGKTTDKIEEMNIGEKVAEVAKKPLQDLQSMQGINNLQIGEELQGIEGVEELQNVPNLEGLTGLPFLNNINSNVTEMLEKQINSMLLPYKSFFKPVIAIFIYLMISFIGSLAYYITVLLLNPLFKLARAFRFIKIQTTMVEQENPSF